MVIKSSLSSKVKSSDISSTDRDNNKENKISLPKGPKKAGCNEAKAQSKMFAEDKNAKKGSQNDIFNGMDRPIVPVPVGIGTAQKNIQTNEMDNDDIPFFLDEYDDEPNSPDSNALNSDSEQPVIQSEQHHSNLWNRENNFILDRKELRLSSHGENNRKRVSCICGKVFYKAFNLKRHKQVGNCPGRTVSVPKEESLSQKKLDEIAPEEREGQGCQRNFSIYSLTTRIRYFWPYGSINFCHRIWISILQVQMDNDIE